MLQFRAHYIVKQIAYLMYADEKKKLQEYS